LELVFGEIGIKEYEFKDLTPDMQKRLEAITERIANAHEKNPNKRPQRKS